MYLGSLTIKDVLVKKFGDEKAVQILGELQEGINQKLSVDELRQKAKSAAEQDGEPAVSSAITTIGATSAAAVVVV